MAAPVPAWIQLPLDTGNTGKLNRTQTRVVDADEVNEHFVIPITERAVVGEYKGNVGVQTVPAAVHNGTTTGFIWLINPVASTILMAVKRIETIVNFTALAVDLLCGELRACRFTFTGVASAGLVTVAKHASTDAANIGELRTASTTLVCTLGATISSNLYPTMDLVTGGAGHWPAQRSFLCDSQTEQDEIILAPGEGIVIWHAVAVTAANRRLITNVVWEEYET